MPYRKYLVVACLVALVALSLSCAPRYSQHITRNAGGQVVKLVSVNTKADYAFNDNGTLVGIATIKDEPTFFEKLMAGIGTGLGRAAASVGWQVNRD